MSEMVVYLKILVWLRVFVFIKYVLVYKDEFIRVGCGLCLRLV